LYIFFVYLVHVVINTLHLIVVLWEGKKINKK
jgi:hypothetical protein